MNDRRLSSPMIVKPDVVPISRQDVWVIRGERATEVCEHACGSASPGSGMHAMRQPTSDESKTDATC